MDRDSSALQPVSISLATNDFSCCTTTNGLCPPLLSYLPPSSLPSLPPPLSLCLSFLPFYLLLLDAALSLHFTAAPPLSRFYRALVFLFLRSPPALSRASASISLSPLLPLFGFSSFIFTCLMLFFILRTAATTNPPKSSPSPLSVLISVCSAWMGNGRNKCAVSVLCLSFSS